jgi:hypothetical protein
MLRQMQISATDSSWWPAQITALACAVAMLGAGLLMFAGPVSATPTLTFKAAFVPIAGDPAPSDVPGSGASMRLEYGISGSEYGGFPPPLIGVNLFFPEGVALHPQGFPTCSAETLKESGEGACSQESLAGPAGNASVTIPVNNVPSPENIAVQPYFAPGGGLELYLKSPDTSLVPIVVESVAAGRFRQSWWS